MKKLEEACGESPPLLAVLAGIAAVAGLVVSFGTGTAILTLALAFMSFMVWFMTLGRQH